MSKQLTQRVTVAYAFSVGGGAVNIAGVVTMWTKASKNGGTGSGGGGASIAQDMYFTTTSERDQFTTDNPSRIFQGVTCAIENASAYDYYQYDMLAPNGVTLT